MCHIFSPRFLTCSVILDCILNIGNVILLWLWILVYSSKQCFKKKKIYLAQLIWLGPINSVSWGHLKFQFNSFSFSDPVWGLLCACVSLRFGPNLYTEFRSPLIWLSSSWGPATSLFSNWLFRTQSHGSKSQCVNRSVYIVCIYIWCWGSVGVLWAGWGVEEGICQWLGAMGKGYWSWWDGESSGVTLLFPSET